MRHHLMRALTLLVVAVCAVPAAASGYDSTPNRYVMMTGVGTVKAMPDTAVISGGVLSQGQSAGEALRASRQAMAKAVAALKAIGIADKQITTSSFSFAPQYAVDKKGNVDTRTIAGYRVSNRVTVTLSQLDRAGDVLDALIEHGANDATTVNFELRNTEALEMQARTEAGRNALKRAEVYVKSIGAELGTVLSVREGNQSDPGDFSLAAPSVAIAAPEAAPPPPTRIEAGEQDITQIVTIVWALK